MTNHNRPETIEGYVPPSEIKYSRQGVYKTFTEGQKKQIFGKTNVGKQYAAYGEYVEEKCPECSEQSIKTCVCGYSDKICINGHSWYTDRNGKIKKGNPHS
jgi:hypothetical protein